jgi:sialic acid synthase SpsE
LGTADYAPTVSENASRIYRRSLYVVKPIKAGEAFTAHNIRTIRPGYGLPPGMFDEVVQGGTATCDLQPATALKREHIKF